MGANDTQSPEERWKHLREGGKKTLVNLESNDLINEKPPWFDEERFARAKEIIQKYFIGVSYSSFTGLLLIVQLPEGLEPLLSTGNSKDIPSLYRRYLNTILHVNSWYDDDVFNPETKGYKSIRQVRAMHKRLQTSMNEKFKVNDCDGNPRLWFTQYDVAMTQFAFIGLAMLYPKKTAMIAATTEELELINYYWRVLGYLTGVDDEYNACHFEKYEDIRKFNELIFEHEFRESLDNVPCKKGLDMSQSICTALHYFMPLLTFNNLAHWWKDHFKFNGYEPQPMSAREKVLDCWTRLSFNHLMKHEGFLRFSVKLHRRRFAKRCTNKDKVYEKLKAQYENDAQHMFYSDRFDYFVEHKPDTVTANTFAQDAGENVEGIISCRENDDNNNNNQEQVHIKRPVLDGCPFGYGSLSGQIAAPSADRETGVAA